MIYLSVDYKLKDYQLVAVKRILAGLNTWLIYPMGKGKTLITLSAIKYGIEKDFYKKVLIVAPLKVCETTWLDEPKLFNYLLDLNITFYRGDNRSDLINNDNSIYLVNNELLEKFVLDYTSKYKKWDFDLLVIDESTKFKNTDTKRFKIMKKISANSRQVLLLTGTPLPKDYLELYAPIYYLDKGLRLGKSMSSYKQKYFYPLKYNYSNARIVYEWGITNQNKEIINNLIKDLCLTLPTSDSSASKIVSNVVMDKNAYDSYSLFKREFMLELDENKSVATNAAVLVGKLLQVAGGAVYGDDDKVIHIHNAKIDKLLELIKSTNDNIILFYHYKHHLDLIKKALKENNVNYRVLKSKNSQDDWNKGLIKVLLAHPVSCGYGLNLQFGGNVIIWFTLPFSLEIYQQANARLDRQGQTKQVKIYHLLCEDTVDYRIYDVLQQRSITQKEFINFIYE